MISEIRPCAEKEFSDVIKYIADFELDDRQLNWQDFLLLYSNNSLVGFGRIRKYQHFSELCSLGILPGQRSRGFGAQLVKALQERNTAPLYLVTIIPEYFKRFGFEVCNTYPPEIKEKLNYCEEGLPVEEKYRVMQWQKLH